MLFLFRGGMCSGVCANREVDDMYKTDIRIKLISASCLPAWMFVEVGVDSAQSALSLIAVPQEDNKNKVILSQFSLQGFVGQTGAIWGRGHPCCLNAGVGRVQSTDVDGMNTSFSTGQKMSTDGLLLDSSNSNLNGFDCINRTRAAVLAQISVLSMLCVSWLLHLQSLEWKNESSSYLCSHHAPDFGVCETEIALSWVACLGLEQMGRPTL